MISHLTATVRTSTRTRMAASCALALGLGTAATGQITIDNDRGSNDPGYFEITVTSGGESRDATVRGTDLSDNSQITTEVLFDYFSYVNVGNGAFRLNNATSGPTLIGDDTVRSSGSFTGAGGNTINWTMTSTIANNALLYENRIELTAQTGTLGPMTFYQYLDEDVLGVSDDVFFTRGSVAGGDLELFTLDGATGIGVSQSGAYTTGQGLRNAQFIGFAADDYNDIKPRLETGTQQVSTNGVIDTAALPQVNSELLDATVRGPNDVVSVMGWSISQGATSAVIETYLGGVTDGGSLPLPEPGNFEITVNVGELVEQSLYVEDEGGTPLAVTLLNGGQFVGPGGVRYRPGYSTLTRVVSWDTTGIPEGEYVLSFNIRNASGQFDNGSVTVTIIPEPASLAVLGLGGLCLATRRRRA